MQADARPDDPARLAALDDYAAIRAPRSAQFDEIPQLAAVLCRVPIAVVCLADADTQHMLAGVGLPLKPAPLADAILPLGGPGTGCVEVPDLSADERFRESPLVVGPHKVRFWAGVALISPDGARLGTLSVMDREPRSLMPADRMVLETLAGRVMAELELRRQTRETLDLADRLRRTLSDRRRILGVVSHDMRTPLSAVHLAADEVTEGSGCPAAQRALTDRLRHAVQHMHRLIDDLADPDSMRDGTLSIRPNGLSVAHLVRQAIDITRPVAQARGIALHVSVDRDAGHAIWDADRVTQVVENLIANALKFTPQGRSVTVRVAATSAEVVLNVIDAGDGIPPARLKTIYEPYVHDGAGQLRGAGMGMGVVRDIVESHGGAVAISSVLGEGTDICVRLPREVPSEVRRARA